jgi:uncharacterized protein
MDVSQKLYNDFNSWLKRQYNAKVRRIAIDAGFSCPNREQGKSGCLYCLDGSASVLSDRKKDVSEQIGSQVQRSLEKDGSLRFIAYFQAYTNTYAPAEKLRRIFSSASVFPEVIALAIGTRPDCIDSEKLEAIKNAAKGKDVWLEFGLQSVNSRTLRFIRRGHGIKAFQSAVRLTKEKGFKAGAHVILGFPWETQKDIVRLARFLSACNIDFIKIHLLHVLKNTPLEKLYRKKLIVLPTMKKYVGLSADLIERLPRTVVIQRLTGEGTRDTHIAPKWALNKTKVIDAINEELRRRKSFQGKLEC